MTYLPEPPALPNVVPPAKPPHEDSFFVPGTWVWNGRGYAWRAGYWGRIQISCSRVTEDVQVWPPTVRRTM